MVRALLLSSCILLAACVTEDETTPPSLPTQDEHAACGWLAGGDCGGKEDGTGGLTSYDWRSPYFWGDLYLAKYASQRAQALANIEPGPAPLTERRTVLLVTGITIRAAWLDAIVARLRRDGFDPVVYEPPVLLTGGLLQASKDLAVVVDRVKAQSGQQTIDILAECTGGVIARYFVQFLGGDTSVAHLVTFVSPQHGLAAAPLVARMVGWPALHDLSPGSEFLLTLNSTSPPPAVAMTSIYTCTDEYIQPYTTSIVPGATNVALCGHGFVGHFQTMYDPSIYRMMYDALVR